MKSLNKVDRLEIELKRLRKEYEMLAVHHNALRELFLGCISSDSLEPDVLANDLRIIYNNGVRYTSKKKFWRSLDATFSKGLYP